MNVINTLKFLFSAAIPVVASVLLWYWLTRSAKARTLSFRGRQILCGLIFGAVAVAATELGIDTGSAILNVRNAAPLCAALIFGGPAGILAGVIGGAERWLAVFWGAAAYTQAACSLGTVLAGLLGAAFRRFVFEDRIPVWYYGLLIGVFVEVLDMLLIMLLHMSDIAAAFRFVEQIAPSMISLNGTCVMLAVLFVSLMARGVKQKKGELRDLSQSFQRWLAALVLAAFASTTSFVWVLQSRLSEENASALLQLNLEDAQENVLAAIDRIMLDEAALIEFEVLTTTAKNMDLFLEILAWEHDISEISLVNDKGIITASTNPDYIGFDMASGEQSAEFLVLLDGEKEFVQDFGSITYDDGVEMKYAGVALDDGGFVQVGFDSEIFADELEWQVMGEASNRRVGESGYLLVSDNDGQIVSEPDEHHAATLRDAGIDLSRAGGAGAPFTADVFGQPSLCMYSTLDRYVFAQVMPLAEVYAERDLTVYVTVFVEIIIFAGLFLLVFCLIKRLIVDDIRRINGRLAQITGGDLDVIVDVRTNQEFASLSDDINSTVDTLKHYIDEAAARIDEELEFARAIQLSSLPQVFPPYPDRTDFEIFALMRTAKEVGGDFYDFCLLGDDHMLLLAADVSGKGIPAAMFMMTAKTLIKDLAQTGADPAEILTRANSELCRNNDANMFVTVWLGIVDLNTGVITYANAGHNPPLVCQPAEEFSFLKTRPGLVLAGMDGIRYRQSQLTLMPGGRIFLYTDGVTEAVNSAEDMYENDRLKAVLNRHRGDAPREICDAVAADVDAFADGEPQFDDMTMVLFSFSGARDEDMKQIETSADIAELPRIVRFAEEVLNESSVPQSSQTRVLVAIDEIFSNIARCSGADFVRTAIRADGQKVTVRFTDNGKPYDPTAVPEPDISLAAEKRGPGGLGLLLTRRLMDTVRYEYVDRCNVLILEKSCTPPDGSMDQLL